jgi:hypothetical protein
VYIEGKMPYQEKVEASRLSNQSAPKFESGNPLLWGDDYHVRQWLEDSQPRTMTEMRSRSPHIFRRLPREWHYKIGRFLASVYNTDSPRES